MGQMPESWWWLCGKIVGGTYNTASILIFLYMYCGWKKIGAKTFRFALVHISCYISETESRQCACGIILNAFRIYLNYNEEY
jgi:hypothetical protein